MVLDYPLILATWWALVIVNSMKITPIKVYGSYKDK